MIIAIFVGFITWLICMIRKNGFKKSSVKACVSFAITTGALILVNIGVLATTGWTV